MHPLSTNPAQTDWKQNLYGQRRRRVRHKIHLPAHAALARLPGVQHEIVDLSEDGMAIQTAAPVEFGWGEQFCLVLPETEALIPTSGTLVWQNQERRVGIHFAEMPEEARHALKKWLFANALAALASHSSATQRRTGTKAELSPHGTLHSLLALDEEPIPPDYTTVLSALAAVRKEVDALGNDLDAALHLIARRTQSFTRATGCAIALSESSEMICRATAGRDTPALGAQLTTASGFSGECLRSGRLERCDDSETDPRADRDSCRALGIRSMLAVPIHRDGTVVGLLEVFASEPGAFGTEMELVFLQLSELASLAVGRAAMPAAVTSSKPAAIDDEFPVETPADLPLPQILGSRNLLLMGAAATVFFVVVWLAGPWSSGDLPRPPQLESSSVSAPPAPRGQPSGNLQALEKLAEQGDPEAEFSLGARYALGQQVAQDNAQAAHWFLAAAQQGNVAAQVSLSSIYEAGRGLPRDLSKAYYWALLGEAGGDAGGKARAASLATRLGHDDLVAMQQQAKQWIKQHRLPSAQSPAS